MSAVQIFLVGLSLATLLNYYFFSVNPSYNFVFLFGLYDFQGSLRRQCPVSFFALPTRNNNCEEIQHYCGDTAFKLKFPFRFEGDPRSCGKPEFELSCRHNRTILHLKSQLEGDYYVDVNSIDYERRIFRVTDPGVRKNDCSTLPLYSFNPSYRLSPRDWHVALVVASDVTMQALVFVRCKRQPKRNLLGDVTYIDTAPCNVSANQFSSHHSKSSQIYAVLNLSWRGIVAPRDIQESCTITKIVPIQIEYHYFQNKSGNLSFQDIHNLLQAQGYWLFFNLKYRKLNWLLSVWCYLVVGFWNLMVVFSARYVIGLLLLVAFLIYKCNRRHLSMYDTVEEFLQRNSLMPIRYSYREIKAMTNNFKEKLGEGGYGLVYKGKLRSGSLVAVKMLNKSSANGQEFINEVMTIGRIHHVNVVRLVGFCVTSSKRALVYDYMPNSSLDKFIKSNSFSWKTAYEIAMGVARGIAYLHQGCNMQILHFDIKPHNILLDEDFVPKVSDFGLAKLYPAQDGYVASLTGVRGTPGYIAPELVYKKVGRVSNKADVYSFGMLVMDMAGRWRKGQAEHSSQIYFTSWVHDKFEQGVDIEIGDQVTDEEKAIAKKLILIALWCVQMTPTDRPSMREVIEMLQGDLEGLQLPAKPQFYPTDSPLDMQSGPSSEEESAEPLYSRSVTLEIEQIGD